MSLNIKKLHPDAITPKFAHKGDAGLDLHSIEETYHLRPLERKVFKTGIAVQIPEGYYGQIFGRSGNAAKLGLIPLGGVIDSTFRGELGVILYNTNGGDETNTVEIKKGMKIAQMVILPCENNFEVEEVSEFTEIVNDESDNDKVKTRGSNGFGSTDKVSNNEEEPLEGSISRIGTI